jgi:hypothetical protein
VRGLFIKVIIVIFFKRKENTIEFELKNFSNEFNQNKTTVRISSPEYKFGKYDWSIAANVAINSNNKFFLCTYLQCKSSDENNFPVNVLMNFYILNNQKDSRRDLKNCK